MQQLTHRYRTLVLFNYTSFNCTCNYCPSASRDFMISDVSSGNSMTDWPVKVVTWQATAEELYLSVTDHLTMLDTTFTRHQWTAGWTIYVFSGHSTVRNISSTFWGLVQRTRWSHTTYLMFVDLTTLLFPFPECMQSYIWHGSDIVTWIRYRLARYRNVGQISECTRREQRKQAARNMIMYSFVQYLFYSTGRNVLSIRV